MNNFTDALRTGMDAAETASAEKTEIDALLSELNFEVRRATNGIISAELKAMAFGRHDPFLINLAIFFSGKSYTALVLKNLRYASLRPVEIAKWTQDTIGYPCRIMIGQDEYVCNDKASLTQILQKLLSDPIVGIAIKKLSQSKPTQDDNVVGETTSGTIVGKTAVGKVHGKTTSGTVVGKTAERKVTGKTASATIVGKTAVRKVTGKTASGTVVGKTRGGKIAGKSVVGRAVK